MSPGIGIVFALLFGVPFGLLGGIRKHDATKAAIINVAANVVILFFFDSITIEIVRPMFTFPGLTTLIIVNLAIVLIVSAIVDGIVMGNSYTPSLGDIGGGLVASVVVIVVVSVVALFGHNSGNHNAYQVSHLVSVVNEASDQLPASTTSNLVIVTPDIAHTKASSAMSYGIAGQRNYNTYLSLGPATLQYVDGTMWYVFPLEFDGHINKSRLHSINPGYIMVNGQDPGANVVEHYDGKYTMIVSLKGGQGSEPDRWAYDHGYRGYTMDDSTLEIDDQGRPYYTVTLMRPRMGWTFMAPVGVLVINAHTGQITKYGLNDTPSWVDRVYGSAAAKQIVNWYGFYNKAPFGGRGNTNRFHVSGTPLLVYTGDGHPSWRMLLTSFGTDSSTYRIVEMDAHSGAMQIYIPQQAMSTEGPVNSAFASPSSTSAQFVKADHLRPVGLSLHLIYGHLTWMTTYQTEGNGTSFAGLGFVDAYHASANFVAFGSTKSAALAAYLQVLASEPNANGTTPGAGSKTKFITGVIDPNGYNWDITGGQKYFYIQLVGSSVQYVGTVTNDGPALLTARPGNHVTIKILQVTASDPNPNIVSFTDNSRPASLAGQ